SHRATAMDAGAANFFCKPFKAHAFVTAIRAALSTGLSPVSSQPEKTAVSGRWNLLNRNPERDLMIKKTWR
ncbi:MAG TPA: hypothetical protein VFU37_20460, partial [Pyrinomonadaceae bacterium]|nr:hypothetical protein [Pyrinomonadaceae bacterium]